MTKAGIHADGLLKDEEIYNIFDTNKILGRPAMVSVGKTSGLAGIAYWLNAHFRLVGTAAIDKRSPIVAMMKEKIDAEYEDGRQTEFSTEELENLAYEASDGALSK